MEYQGHRLLRACVDQCMYIMYTCTGKCGFEDVSMYVHMYRSICMCIYHTKHVYQKAPLLCHHLNMLYLLLKSHLSNFSFRTCYPWIAISYTWSYVAVSTLKGIPRQIAV